MKETKFFWPLTHWSNLKWCKYMFFLVSLMKFIFSLTLLDKMLASWLDCPSTHWKSCVCGSLAAGQHLRRLRCTKLRKYKHELLSPLQHFQGKYKLVHVWFQRDNNITLTVSNLYTIVLSCDESHDKVVPEKWCNSIEVPHSSDI